MFVDVLLFGDWNLFMFMCRCAGYNIQSQAKYYKLKIVKHDSNLQSFVFLAWWWNKRHEKCAHEHDRSVGVECQGWFVHDEFSFNINSFLHEVHRLYLSKQFCHGFDFTCAVQSDNKVSFYNIKLSAIIYVYIYLNTGCLRGFQWRKCFVLINIFFMYGVWFSYVRSLNCIVGWLTQFGQASLYLACFSWFDLLLICL